ncbi:YHS domain-containing protein [Devosia pacifica]|uniref:YHS domain-containing protein n=1 Tax=Devosia pacifica TaxID=1335967 RepID=UPI001675CEE0
MCRCKVFGTTASFPGNDASSQLVDARRRVAGSSFFASPSVQHFTRSERVSCNDLVLRRRGPEMKVADPVCGKTVDLGEAEAVDYRGWAYFFCSTACRAAFLHTPDRYAESRQGRATPHGQIRKSPRTAQ